MNINNFKKKYSGSILILVFVLMLGFLLRIYNINWDGSCCQHPDERAIIIFTLPLSFPKNINDFLLPTSTLNPHFFAYGNLPLYLLKGASSIAAGINPELITYSKMDLVGRGISVLADVITIFIIFKITLLLFDKKTALFSAFIYSVSVLPIQYSHFYTADILLTMLITITLLRIVKFYKNPGVINAVIVGIVFGASLATKISAIPILISIAAALLADFLFIFLRSPHKPKNWFPHIPHILKKLATEGVLIVTASITTFVILEPYALIDFKTFIAQNIQQAQMTRDAYVFPYTLQYVGKIPFLYEIKNIFFWGLGPAISMIALFGIINLSLVFKKMPQAKKVEISIIMVFFILYFVTVSKFAVGWMRYMLPVYPIFAMLSGIFLSRTYQRIKNLKLSLFILSFTILIFIILVWPISFMSIYTKTNTRIESTNWVNKTIPAGSSLTHELWDDTVPMENQNQYNIIDLGLYDQPDNLIKWDSLNEKINKSDYIVIASNRLYIPIQKLSDCSRYKVCFPLASKFYAELFAEKLGFRKVAEFTSYPTIPVLNYIIKDDSADESFTVYDHPKIMVFKKDGVVNKIPIL